MEAEEARTLRIIAKPRGIPQKKQATYRAIRRPAKLPVYSCSNRGLVCCVPVVGEPGKSIYDVDWSCLEVVSTGEELHQ